MTFGPRKTIRPTREAPHSASPRTTTQAAPEPLRIGGTSRYLDHVRQRPERAPASAVAIPVVDARPEVLERRDRRARARAPTALPGTEEPRTLRIVRPLCAPAPARASPSRIRLSTRR